MSVRHVEAQSRVSSVFFFQAEDGIRDLTVTGVQTCALPIGFGFGRSDGGTIGEALCQELRVLMVLREAAEIAVQGVERRGGENSRLPHPPAQPLADLPGELAAGRGEGEARPDGTAESLRET